jgi:virginiamycin B lyase
VLSAVALVLYVMAASHAATDSDGALPSLTKPMTVSKVDAVLHQLQSTANKPFTLVEYTVPTPNAVPHILAIDKADHIWFSESGGQFAHNFIDTPPVNKIGRLDQSGTISEWVLGEELSSPMGVVFDQAGNLWVAERLGNRITCLKQNGESKRYPIPTPNAWPTGIAIDSKGKVWFTETKGDKIGVVDAVLGTLSEYALPTTKTMSTGIVVDHEDNVWIAERDVNIIGRFDQGKHQFTQYNLPTKDARPCGVTVDDKGKLWFSERNGGKLGTISRDGSIQEFAVPNRFSGPFIMAADRRGDIWFSEIFSNQIGRFIPGENRFEHFPLSSDQVHPAGVAVDSKGNIWFAQQSSNKIGLIVRTDLSYIGGGHPGTGNSLMSANANFKINEFEIPTRQSIPGIIGVDRHDTIWFTQMGGGFVGPGFPPGSPGGKIGYIRNGVMGELETPTRESGPTSLSRDPCGDDMWFTLRAANKIARVRDFKVTEYDIPVPDSLPVGITVDRDHNVWVALSNASKLGRRTPAGEWRFLDLPDPDAQPRTIFADEQNEVWFAEKVGNHVGWVDQKNWRVERWLIPTRLAWPLSLETDDAGNLWFAEMRSDKLGMLDRKTKVITEYTLPVNSAPFKLLYDKQNSAFWVSTVFANAILRFDLESKKINAVYKVPNEGAWVGGLDRDSQHCIWFSEQFANKIGRLCIEGVATNSDKSEPQASEIKGRW